jgi:hypothetical protein
MSYSRYLCSGLGGALILMLWVGAAQAQIYRCENSNGVIEYSNAPTSGRERGCKAVDLPSITTIPAPKSAPRANATGTSAPTTRTPSPEGFPKVDGPTQKARDSDRRRILEDELAKEEAKLTELRKEFNGGEPDRRGDERNYQKYLDRVQRLKDDIERSEVNTASLKRELAGIRE